MKKSLLIIGTVALLGMLAVYAIPLSTKKSTALSSSLDTSATPTAATSEVTTPVATANPTSATSASSNSTSTYKDGTYTGSSASNPFGDVQIKLTISGGKITDVTTLDYPSADRRSLQISQYAIPQLKQEVLAGQSTNIDSISGASYTSQSFVESLQTAIQQAKA